jgi:MarR family 2-MHQ and catechol resistance regulon transcriptional repressor
VSKPRELMLYVPNENQESLFAAFGNNFEEQSGRALYAMRACLRLFNTRISEWLSPFGLDPTSMNVLIWLYAANGGKGVMVKELGRYIHSEGPNLTATISAIEAKGLIARTINAADRRSIIVKLTKTGSNVMQRAFPLHARNLNIAFGALTLRERKQLVSMLVKIGERIQGSEPFESAELPSGLAAKPAAKRAPRTQPLGARRSS